MAKLSLDISSPIISDFTKSMAEYVRSTLPSTGETFRGTVISVDGDEATILLDGSTVNTVAEVQADVRANDPVIVEIKNHQATIIRNLNFSSGESELPNGDDLGYGAV